MPNAVTDTHALIWYLQDDSRLSTAAVQYFDACETDGGRIQIPTICLVEIIYLAEKGRIPIDVLGTIRRGLTASDTIFILAPLDELVVNSLAMIQRTAVPDMPDRIIAATALAANLPLISRDGKIRLSGIATIW